MRTTNTARRLLHQSEYNYRLSQGIATPKLQTLTSFCMKGLNVGSRKLSATAQAAMTRYIMIHPGILRSFKKLPSILDISSERREAIRISHTERSSHCNEITVSITYFWQHKVADHSSYPDYSAHDDKGQLESSELQKTNTVLLKQWLKVNDLLCS